MLLTRLIRRGAGRTPDRAALVFGELTTTYEQLHHDVARFAQYLIESGVKVGDRLTILGPNSDRVHFSI